MRNLILRFAMLVLAFTYAVPFYDDMEGSRLLLYGNFEKPFAYRALVPIFSNFVMGLYPVPFNVLPIFIFMVSAVAFVFAFEYLASAFYIGDLELLSISALALFILLFGWPARWLYDFPTAFFFALGLALLVRGRLLIYLFIFTLSTINRETTFLLIPVFMLYTFKRIKLPLWLAYGFAQTVILSGIQFVIRYQLRDLPGSPLWFAFYQNLIDYQAHASLAILNIFIFAAFLILVTYGWKSKPEFLRLAFLCMFPFLFIVFILFGRAFEYRVFIEAFPAAILLILPNILQKRIQAKTVAAFNDTNTHESQR